MLSVVCLMFQVLLVVGWINVSTHLRSWTRTLQKGWTPEGTSSLEKALPLMCNQVHKNVVSWKGGPRLKISSDEWLTKANIEEQRGQTMTQVFGLTVVILVGSLLGSVLNLDSSLISLILLIIFLSASLIFSLSVPYNAYLES